MLTFASFGAGFLMRPVGAVVLGAYVDRVGRRRGLLLTLAIMAVGGRGVVCVGSNVAPSEMAQVVEFAEKGDYTAARRLFLWLLPLLQVNFVESNPIPVKAAMAAMGLLEENYRLPLVPPSAAAREKVLRVLQNLKLGVHEHAR